MKIRQLIDFIEVNRKELLLVNVGNEELPDQLASYFADHNVTIDTVTTASGGPTDVAIVSDRSTVYAIVDAKRLETLIETVPTGPGGVGIADGDYDDILGPLKETTFTAHDRKSLLNATREIEDRARRVGEGTIHAGFQEISRLREQRDLYRELALVGLDVHVYGVPDVDPPDLGDATIHEVDTAEIAQSWFVFFDGGGHPQQKSALLAREREPGTYTGAWTYDAGIVDRAIDHLEQTYGEQSQHESRS